MSDSQPGGYLTHTFTSTIHDQFRSNFMRTNFTCKVSRRNTKDSRSGKKRQKLHFKVNNITFKFVILKVNLYLIRFQNAWKSILESNR